MTVGESRTRGEHRRQPTDRPDLTTLYAARTRIARV